MLPIFRTVLFYNLNNACYLEGKVIGVTLNIDNCRINNITSVGLSNAYGTMKITNTTLSRCAYAVWVQDNCYTTMTDSSVFLSTSGVTNYGKSLSINRCTFSYNSGGSVIYNYQGCQTNIQNSLIVENTQSSSRYCFENSGTITVTNATIAGNTRTFKNSGTMNLRNTICPTDSSVTRTNCMNISEAKLGVNYHPSYSSACVDKGNNGYSSSSYTDLDDKKRILNGTVDIGCYEYMPVSSWADFSGKATIYWENTGADSYTVEYRVENSQKWTKKVVKNKTELTISVKNNTLYEVLVTPEGVDRIVSQTIYSGALGKLGVKVSSKSDDSVSFKISNVADLPEMGFWVGIQAPNDYYRYYRVSRNYSDSIGSYSYTFYSDILTIKGLRSNTKYNFGFEQENQYQSSYALSTTAKMSAVTAKARYNTPAIRSLSVSYSGVRVNWNTVYGKNTSEPAEKYTVQYRVSGTSQWKTATTSATGTSFLVMNLKSGTLYQFRICASRDNLFLESLYSGVKTATAK